MLNRFGEILNGHDGKELRRRAAERLGDMILRFFIARSAREATCQSVSVRSQVDGGRTVSVMNDLRDDGSAAVHYERSTTHHDLGRTKNVLRSDE